MRKAQVQMHNRDVGILTEENSTLYTFQYNADYTGSAISLTMPVQPEPYSFDSFPPFFDGLLPEGGQLEGLLKIYKIDKTDYFSQLVTVGSDLIGAVTVRLLDE